MFRAKEPKGGGEPAQVWFSQLPDRQDGGSTMRIRSLLIATLAGMSAASGGLPLWEAPMPYPIGSADLATVFQIRAQHMRVCPTLRRERVLKSTKAMMGCIYFGYLDALTAAQYPAVDLEQEKVAVEYVVAEMIDKKHKSIAEAQLYEAKEFSRIQSEYDARMAVLQQTMAQQQAAQAQSAQAQATMQANADAESRRMHLCMGTALSMPTQGGSALESFGNAGRAQLYCEAGLLPPVPPPPATPQAPPMMPPPLPTHTQCQATGDTLDCTTQ